MPPEGFNLSKGAAVDYRRRPRGHWDWQQVEIHDPKLPGMWRGFSFCRLNTELLTGPVSWHLVAHGKVCQQRKHGGKDSTGVISGFRLEVDKNCAFLCYHVASSGNPYRRFGATYRSNRQGSRIQKKAGNPNMGFI